MGWRGNAKGARRGRERRGLTDRQADRRTGISEGRAGGSRGEGEGGSKDGGDNRTGNGGCASGGVACVGSGADAEWFWLSELAGVNEHSAAYVRK